MGRKREFDTDEVVERAMSLFWQRGFEATSVADLMSAMALHKGSLYKAFGDKQGLFLEALERYLEGSIEGLRSRARSAPSLRRGIFDWLSEQASSCQAKGVSPGCFAVNASCELGADEGPIGQRLRRHWSDLESALAALLCEAQQGKEISSDHDAAWLARLLLATLCGQMVLLRSGHIVQPINVFVGLERLVMGAQARQ